MSRKAVARAAAGAGRDASDRRPMRRWPELLPPPLVWSFDGPLDRCLADLEDALRRAILLVGDVSRIALLIDLSLPALLQRVRAGDALQPAWGDFVRRVGEDYGLPDLPRVRHLRTPGPLATLVVAYRS